MALKYDEVMKAKKFLPLKMKGLTPEFVERARRELNETDENRGRCIRELRERILAVPGLSSPVDDFYLLQFLRVRKFDLNRAFNLMMGYYEVKSDYNEIYDHIDTDVNQSLLKGGQAACLPYRNTDGSVVVLFKVNGWDPKEHNMTAILLCMTSMILLAVEFPASQICGVHLLFDMKGCNMKQVRAITPYYINLFVKALKNSLPVRFRGVHIYNESAIFNYIWAIAKMFLTEKIRKRVHFHGDSQKSLHRHFAKEILPAEYGGDNKDFDSAVWGPREMKLYYEKMQYLTSFGYNKSC